MTVNQSSSTSNSHRFLGRRSRDSFISSGDSFSVVEASATDTEDNLHGKAPTPGRASDPQDAAEVASYSLEQHALEQSLLDGIDQRMASAVELQVLLAETVAEIQQGWQVDRVLVIPLGDRPSIESSFSPTSLPIESHHLSIPSAIEYAHKHEGKLIWIATDSDHIAYRQGQIDVVEDISHATLLLPQRTWLEALKVKAYVNLPIVIHQQLWGMLMVQHCSHARPWSSSIVANLKRLARRLALAIEQSELRKMAAQTKKPVAHLSDQTQPEPDQSLALQSSSRDTPPPYSASSLSYEEMAPLRQSLKFAELVLEVTERIRDSLDEAQILQTATQELAKALNVERCKIELYDPSLSTATVAYEHALVPPNCIGMTRQMADFPELYEPLFQHQPVQFVVPPSSNLRLVNMTRLACPIFDDQGMLGNLWLFRPRHEMFRRWEVRIIQQIANECAIAIRQARLYEASQKQVRELERLNQLKDDFLKTISHELRTPLSSIILGVQTLERVLEQAPKEQDRQTLQRLFQTVHMECHRENKLIEDLLTFCYLEAGKGSLMSTSIDLNRWLTDIIKPFQLRMQNQQQQLTVKLSDQLPPLRTELAYLERIVSELLNNACKYTPQNEHIIIPTSLTTSAEETRIIPANDAAPQPERPECIMLSVQNSGVEIPKEEQGRIFDKFYRIPSSDPWQYGGTGLGLALVKKLTDRLGASVHVKSVDDYTAFVVLFPLGE